MNLLNYFVRETVEKAVVVDKNYNHLEIVFSSDIKDINKCNSCGGIKTCIQTDQAQPWKVDNIFNGSISIGDVVQVSRYKVSQSVAAILLFGVPIFFSIFGLLLGNQIYTNSNGVPYTVVTTLLGGFTGFVLIAILDSYIRVKTPKVQLFTTY